MFPDLNAWAHLRVEDHRVNLAPTSATSFADRHAPISRNSFAEPPVLPSIPVATQFGDSMKLSVNGLEHVLDIDLRTSLLDALREHLHLPGTKKGCNQGACGACTVLADGERINSCLALAVQYEGREITTIEGVGTPQALAELQAAFVEHDGFQCGYCTPGQICSAIGMAAEAERGAPSVVTADLAAGAIDLDHDELRERMSGNLCRCGAYNGIIDAVRSTFVEKEAV